MGIKFRCPNGHKLNVKSFLAGKRGICPQCGVKVVIPGERPEPEGSDVLDESPVPASAIQAAPAVATPAKPSAAGAAPVGGPGAAPAVARPAVARPVAHPGTPTAAPLARPVATQPVHVSSVSAAGTDPIAEAPEAVWYVQPPSGGQYGPAAGPLMRRWISEGRVSADSMVWREGWADWKSAGLLFAELAQPSSAPAAPAPAVPPVPPVPPSPAGQQQGGTPGADFPLAEPRAPTRRAAVTYRARRSSSKSMAVLAVVMLGLISLVLLGVLFYVLQL